MISPLLIAAAFSIGQYPGMGAQPDNQPGLLMQALNMTPIGSWMEKQRLSLSGWTQGSFTASTNGVAQIPYGFNYLANNYMLQQNIIRLEMRTDPKFNGPNWGFRVDSLLPGTDYRFLLQKGFLDSQLFSNNGGPQRTGIDFPQLYTNLLLPRVLGGLDLKVGRFLALYGAESVEAPANLMLSHSYSFIYNPYTHTGGVATLKLGDRWTAQGGVVLGSDVFIDSAASLTGIGSLKRAGDRSMLLFSFIIGPGRYFQTENFNNPQLVDLVGSLAISEKLSVTLEGLYGWQHDTPGVGFANWYGVIGYATRRLGERWALNLRAEYFGDPQGNRTGFATQYVDATAGLSWNLARWLQLRSEIRYDIALDAAPFEGNRNLGTYAFDAILKW